MKDIKSIFETTKAIEERQNRLQEELIELSELQRKLQEECQHDIVFKLYDNTPRKIGIIYNYYCPACNKIVTLHMNRTLEDTPFEESKIISLDGLNIMNSEDYQEVFTIIQKEVFENYSFYYNKDMNIQRLSKSMSETIKDQIIIKPRVKQKQLK